MYITIVVKITHMNSQHANLYSDFVIFSSTNESIRSVIEA